MRNENERIRPKTNLRTLPTLQKRLDVLPSESSLLDYQKMGQALAYWKRHLPKALKGSPDSCSLCVHRIGWTGDKNW